MAATVTIDWGQKKPPPGKEYPPVRDAAGMTINQVKAVVGRWLPEPYSVSTVGLNDNPVLVHDRHGEVLKDGDRLTVSLYRNG